MQCPEVVTLGQMEWTAQRSQERSISSLSASRSLTGGLTTGAHIHRKLALYGVKKALYLWGHSRPDTGIVKTHVAGVLCGDSECLDSVTAPPSEAVALGLPWLL